MENLAYLHLASAYEASETTQFAPIFSGWSLSGLPKIRLLALALALAVLSTAQTALALEPGDSGPEVADLQTQLRDAGYYDGPVSGIYGTLTEAAVSNFQQAQGLEVDGIAGSQTLSALQNLQNISVDSDAVDGSLQRGDSGPEVTTLQNNLRIAGYYNGPSTEYFGSLTEEAVIRFQQDNGLVADGIVGSTTRSALYNVGGAAPISQSFDTFPQPPDQTAFSSYYDPVAYDNTSSTIIQLGSSGSAVTNLQTRLRDLGYYRGRITGYFDDATKRAVTQFQQASGLDPDGIAGPRTFSALQISQPGDRPPTNAYNPPAVKFSVLELQKRLKARGFNPGVLDGQMGPSTRSAIAAAQQFYGVSREDIVGGRF